MVVGGDARGGGGFVFSPGVEVPAPVRGGRIVGLALYGGAAAEVDADVARGEDDGEGGGRAGGCGGREEEGDRRSSRRREGEDEVGGEGEASGGGGEDGTGGPLC